MIIKILGNDEKPICTYAKGRWSGRMDPLIFSEGIEVMFFALKNSSQGAKLFYDIIKDWPEKEPGGPQSEFSWAQDKK